MNHSLSNTLVGKVLDMVPEQIIPILKASPIWLAGGCIRAVLNSEPINDFDLFAFNGIVAEEFVTYLGRRNLTKTKNAYTLKQFNPAVQLIHREFFTTSEEVLKSFDFTICKAAIWWKGGEWASLADENFEPDTKEKVLRYCEPGNNRAPDSLVRALKFTEKGYSLLPSSLAKLVIQTSEEGCYTRLCSIFSGSDDPAQWDETIKSCGSSK